MIGDFNKVARYLAYTLEILVLFMVQETPGLLPSVLGVRPVLLFPAVMAIAMFETEVPALAFGVCWGSTPWCWGCCASSSACWCGCTSR